ncbi:MAG: glycerol kinase GlpK [Agitococcus sp.]|nr:glycerol kinase GlpK [Agitococcus sp.]
MQSYLLSLDQGTTSTRAIIFNLQGQAVGRAQRELKQYFPADGWVEHDALEIAEASLAVCRDALKDGGITAQQIAAIGITNQRETTVVWDRKTGKPVHHAIVWQDRRTADFCLGLKNLGHETMVQKKTGLLLDPYFSATKLAWILDNVSGVRARAERGELAFGTIDTWLIWQLTDGQKHATDATNAARTLIFNIHTQEWDTELLELFNIPASLLPVVQDSASDFGLTATRHLGSAVQIGGVAGDQQAALIGQACFKPGMVKSTYGTGCFMVMNTGDEAITSTHRLLTTVGYRLNGKVTYALEGSIFVAGAAVQWLRDGIQLIKQAGDTEAIAEETMDSRGVYLVPAFTGLGAPYWDPHARGAIFGLTRDTGIGEIVIAGLEAVCFQTRDLIEAMKKDGVSNLHTLRVDGGMAVNNWLMQALANIVGVVVDRPTVTETTALGAAWLAGLHVGKFASLDAIADLWHCQREFVSKMDGEKRENMYAGWIDAVQRVTSK